MPTCEILHIFSYFSINSFAVVFYKNEVIETTECAGILYFHKKEIRKNTHLNTPIVFLSDYRNSIHESHKENKVYADV